MKKICWRYHYFTHVYPKSHLYDVQFLRYGLRQTKIFVILGHFLPFYPPQPHLLMIQKIKILKKNVETTGNIILLWIHVHHKWRSYDIWFRKYKVLQTEVFVILCHFLPFQPLERLYNNVLLKNSIYQKHLELTLNTKLNFVEHIKNITQKIRNTMGLLRRFQPILPRYPYWPYVKHLLEVS